MQARREGKETGAVGLGAREGGVKGRGSLRPNLDLHNPALCQVAA